MGSRKGTTGDSAGRTAGDSAGRTASDSAGRARSDSGRGAANEAGVSARNPEQDSVRFTRSNPLQTDPVAKELAALVIARRREPRLQWPKMNRVRPRIRLVLPPACNATTQPRRRKLYRDLDKRLRPRGWRRLKEGWWEPPDFWLNGAKPGLVEDQLARSIIARERDHRLTWTRAGKVAIKWGRMAPRGAGLTAARRAGLLRDLQERIADHGWLLDPRGRFGRGHHADLTAHRNLFVCGRCGVLARGGGGEPPECPCIRSAPHEPADVTLCRCCGQVVLDMRLDYAVWFCGSCIERAHAVNVRLRRYAIPLGPHCFHGGPGLNRAGTREDVEILIQQWKAIGEASHRVQAWVCQLHWRVVTERMPEMASRWIPVGEWDRRLDVAEHELRFNQMMEFLTQSREIAA
jgi:hypothetical protein